MSSSQFSLFSSISRFFKKNFGSSLVQITRLDLSKNQLKFLTDDFCNLVNLKHIDLYNNQLENLPVTFGRLTKLRYLDLKGNPLQPALQKIVGPCLTAKDCTDAAKQIVPFMSDLEVQLRSEQKKKEEEELKRKEEEALQLREQIRLAKKAARKERVMRERQEKAETENVDARDEPTISETKHANKLTKSQPSNKPTISATLNFFAFLKTFVSVLFIFVSLFYVFVKYLPAQTKSIFSLLPKHQAESLRYAHGIIDKSISATFQKVVNFREE